MELVLTYLFKKHIASGHKKQPSFLSSLFRRKTPVLKSPPRSKPPKLLLSKAQRAVGILSIQLGADFLCLEGVKESGITTIGQLFERTLRNLYVENPADIKPVYQDKMITTIRAKMKGISGFSALADRQILLLVYVLHEYSQRGGGVVHDKPLTPSLRGEYMVSGVFDGWDVSLNPSQGASNVLKQAESNLKLALADDVYLAKLAKANPDQYIPYDVAIFVGALKQKVPTFLYVGNPNDPVFAVGDLGNLQKLEQKFFDEFIKPMKFDASKQDKIREGIYSVLIGLVYTTKDEVVAWLLAKYVFLTFIVDDKAEAMPIEKLLVYIEKVKTVLFGSPFAALTKKCMEDLKWTYPYDTVRIPIEARVLTVYPNSRVKTILGEWSTQYGTQLASNISERTLFQNITLDKFDGIRMLTAGSLPVFVLGDALRGGFGFSKEPDLEVRVSWFQTQVSLALGIENDVISFGKEFLECLEGFDYGHALNNFSLHAPFSELPTAVQQILPLTNVIVVRAREKDISLADAIRTESKRVVDLKRDLFIEYKQIEGVVRDRFLSPKKEVYLQCLTDRVRWLVLCTFWSMMTGRYNVESSQQRGKARLYGHWLKKPPTVQSIVAARVII